MAYYLGKRIQGDQILFQSNSRPTSESTCGRFISATGPFKTRLGAAYFARFGQSNLFIRTCEDAERLAIEDPNPVWQMLREQIEIEMTMTEEELEATRMDEACEYEPDKLLLTPTDISEMLQRSQMLASLCE